jgi:hypothetical protein
MKGVRVPGHTRYINDSMSRDRRENNALLIAHLSPGLIAAGFVRVGSVEQPR